MSEASEELAQSDRRDRWVEAVGLTMKFMTAEFKDLSTAKHVFVLEMLKHLILRTVEKAETDFDMDTMDTGNPFQEG